MQTDPDCSARGVGGGRSECTTAPAHQPARAARVQDVGSSGGHGCRTAGPGARGPSPAAGAKPTPAASPPTHTPHHTTRAQTHASRAREPRAAPPAPHRALCGIPEGGRRKRAPQIMCRLPDRGRGRHTARLRDGTTRQQSVRIRSDGSARGRARSAAQCHPHPGPPRTRTRAQAAHHRPPPRCPPRRTHTTPREVCARPRQARTWPSSGARSACGGGVVSRFIAALRRREAVGIAAALCPTRPRSGCLQERSGGTAKFWRVCVFEGDGKVQLQAELVPPPVFRYYFCGSKF